MGVDIRSFQFYPIFRIRKMPIEWKSMPESLPQLTGDEIPRRLQELGSPWGPEVELAVMPADAGNGRLRGPDFVVRLKWVGNEYDFAAEAKSRSIPKVFDEALRQAKNRARESGLLPMVVVPYLDEKRLDCLAREGVSGLDLAGNGIVIVPGRLLLRRSGQPNRYKESQPVRYAYRSATSLVPRVFLCRPAYASVSAIREEILKRGGAIALSTVSKALARMEEDILIERTGDQIALLQPDELLEKLAQSFQPPKSTRTLSVRARKSLNAIFKCVNRDRARPSLVLSGTSSQDRYAAGLRSDQPLAYCRDLPRVRDAAGDLWEPTERFADLVVAETTDQTPFFDTRCDDEGITFASPVQTFLELNAGDKRDREMAAAVRSRILHDLK
jgi:hypothetical protein